MAFSSPDGCFNQCHAYACTQYMPPNTSGPWDFSQLAVGAVIRDEEIATLAAYINDELARRDSVSWTGINTPYSFGDPLGTDEEGAILSTKIYGIDEDSPDQFDMLIQFKEAINGMTGGSVSYNTTSLDGSTIRYSHIKEAIDQVGLLRDTCLCDGQCGANSTCVCFEDCGTNYYSDKRLKRDIRSL